jgi:hypothetical protein
MAALTGVVVFPVTGEGTPGTLVPYEVVNPYSKKTAVDAPPAFTVPFSVADVEVTRVAAVVITFGRIAGVVKVESAPLMVSVAVVPFTLK